VKNKEGTTDGWERKTLGSIAQITMGQSPDSKHYSTEENGLPFLQGCAEFGARSPRNLLFCSQTKKTAQLGSILFSVRAPVGRINIADRDYIIGRGLAAIKGIDVEQTYLEHYLKHEEAKFRNASQGSTFEAINSKELNDWSIIYPTDRNEQAAIAEILSAVDRAIEQTEALIAKQQRIKTGLMQDLLTRGIDEHGNLRSEKTHKFKDSPLGRIPAEWKVRTLKAAGAWYSGGTPSRANEGFWNGNIPWVSPKDMKCFDIADTIDRITGRAMRSASALIPEGSVLLVVRGMILDHALPICCTTRSMAFNQDVKAIITSADVISRFLAYWFVANERRVLKFVTTATHGTKRLDMSDLHSINVGLPEKDEQLRIVSRLDQQQSQARIITMHLEKLGSLKAALMQDLLTGKKRVISMIDNNGL
jgi:type I restriction enzyme S subunit